MGKPGGDQAEQRLPDLELGQPRASKTCWTSRRAVEQRQQPPLLGRELRRRSPTCARSTEKIRSKDRDLLLDQAPLVHPPGALEQQELGVDPDQEILPLGADAGLEVEGAGASR